MGTGNPNPNPAARTSSTMTKAKSPSSLEATSCPIWRAGDSGRLMKVVLLVLLVLSGGHLVPDLKGGR